MRSTGLTVWVIGVALTGCVAGPPAVTRGAPPALLGNIQITGPKGYCAEQTTEPARVDEAQKQPTSDAPTSETLLMARCADAKAVPPAIIAVTVGQEGSAGIMAAGGAQLASFFASDEGRATLSRRGQPQDVQLIEALSQPLAKTDAFLMRLTEPSMGQHWRAIIGLRGRLVTVAVTGPTDAPLDPAQGRGLLEQTLTALTRANKT